MTNIDIFKRLDDEAVTTIQAWRESIEESAKLFFSKNRRTAAFEAKTDFVSCDKYEQMVSISLIANFNARNNMIGCKYTYKYIIHAHNSIVDERPYDRQIEIYEYVTL